MHLPGAQEHKAEYEQKNKIIPETHNLTPQDFPGPKPFDGGDTSSPFIAVLNPRKPSPIPLPNSGNFFGPNTSNAIPKTTSRCIG
jgi:hypothetical protein